jgi:hypothetical protein
MSNADIAALLVFSLVVIAICSLFIILAVLREKKLALAKEEEAVASQESKEERRRKRKESILNGLIVKEGVPDDPPAESTERDQDNSPSGEAVQAPQPPAPSTNSSLTSCVMGSDDCEFLAGGV